MSAWALSRLHAQPINGLLGVMVSASSSVPATLGIQLEIGTVVVLLNSKIVTMDSSPSMVQSLALTAL